MTAAFWLNVLFHTLALDGVYVRNDQGELTFHSLGEPTEADVQEIAAWTHARLLRVLERHGRSLDGLDETTEPIVDEQPVLASCYAASAGDTQMLGPDPGQRTRELVFPSPGAGASPRLVAEVGGVNVHASPAIA